MKPLLLVCLVPVLLAASPAVRKPAVDPEVESQKQRARVQKLLMETLVKLDGVEDCPLEDFLNFLEQLSLDGKKCTIRFDAKGLGKRLAAVKGAEINCPKLIGVSLATILQIVLGQIGNLDYAIRPEGVLITLPRLASHCVTYDVGPILDRLDPVMPNLLGAFPYVEPDAKANAALLVRLVVNEVNLQSWESIKVLNGRRLSVVASPTRHASIEYLLDGVRAITDVAVVMNARLYEVDRAFFTKHVAPLFPSKKNAAPPATVVAIDGPLFKRITAQKEVCRGDNRKLLLRQPASFLACQEVVSFLGGPHPTKRGKVTTGSALIGVQFEVYPLVSKDRRYLRLQIKQSVNWKEGDKDVPAKAPRLQEKTVSGTVQMEDGMPILMVVPGKENMVKVRLLVARPFIWIEGEAKFAPVTPQSLWESEVPVPEMPKPPARRLPGNEQTRKILQGIVTSVLTDARFKCSLDFYGTAKDKTFALHDGTDIGWPKDFKPQTHGFKLVKPKVDPFVDSNRVVGIRLDRFDVGNNDGTEKIKICLSNAGGTANGPVIGGCSVTYEPIREGKHWKVRFVSMFGQ